MKKHWQIKTFFLVCCCMLITACGFQLRGSITIPAWLNPIYISASNPYSELATELRRQLSTNDITTAENAKDSEYILHIKSITPVRRTLALDSNLDASEFRYEIAVVYELEGPDGEFLIGPDERTVSGRNYQQSSDQLSAEAGQVRKIQQEIYRSLALQMTWRLQALKQPSVKTPEQKLEVRTETLDSAK